MHTQNGIITSVEIIFEIDVVSPQILMEEIDRYNHMHGTDFIIEKIHEETEIFFCPIRTTASAKDIFNLGFGFACYEENLRKQGKIDW